MGADDDIGLARLDRGMDRTLPYRGQRSGEELASHAERLEQWRQAGVMLAGENLGRRHERPLPAGAHDAGQGDRRHCGLAAAHVALQEAAHRDLGGQVNDDLVE